MTGYRLGIFIETIYVDVKNINPWELGIIFEPAFQNISFLNLNPYSSHFCLSTLARPRLPQ